MMNGLVRVNLMNIEEATKICTIIKVAFPNSYKDFGKDDAKFMVQLWQMQFDDIPYNHVWMALNRYISSNQSGFPPTIAQIKDIIYKQYAPKQMNEVEAWQTVLEACRRTLDNDGINYFEKLPPIIQRVLVDEKGLRKIMVYKYDRDAIEKQFKKDYLEAVQIEKENACLPSVIKKAIGLNDKLQIDEKKKMLESEDKLKALEVARADYKAMIKEKENEQY